MGPPTTPITPGNQLVLRTPPATPSPRHGGLIHIKSEPRESTPFRVKLEPGLAPPVGSFTVACKPQVSADAALVSIPFSPSVNAVPGSGTS